MKPRATQTTDRHVRRRWPGYGTALLLILVVAAVLRFTGLDWDNGRYLHPDERFMVMVTVDTAWPETVGGYFDSETSPLNPYNTRHGTFVYGTFPLILTKALSGLFGTDVYGQAHEVGRALSALADTGTVFLVAWMARRFFGNRAGLLAAFLIAFTMLHIQSAHFYTVDAMSVFFATATFVTVVKGWDRKSIAWFAVAGLMAGLAGASKPNYLIALGFFALPVLETVRLHGIDGLFPTARRRVFPVVPAVLVGGLVAFWTFRIGQPYAFSGPHIWNVGLNRQWVDDLSYWSTAQSGLIDIKSSVQWVGRTPVLYIVQTMVAWGMGPPLGIASLAALALGTWRVLRARRWPSWWFLGMLGWSLAQLLLYGTNIAQAQRYLLPIYPFLIAMAAGLLVEVASRFRRGWPQGRYHATRRVPDTWSETTRLNFGHVLIVGTMLYTAVYGVAFDTLFVRPLSRVQASEWIYENIPAGSTLTHEYWDDALPIALEGEDAFAYNMVTLDLYGYEGPGSTKLSRIIGQLNAADYIILSSNRIIGSVPRQPERYPMASHYYEMLENGDLGFELVAEFSQVPELFGIRFDDTNAEETITVYEHPYVRIFRKTDAFDVGRVYAELDTAMGYGGVNYLPGDPVGEQMFLTDGELADFNARGTWSAIYNPGNVFNRAPALWWYIGLQVLAVPALPLAWVLFRRFPDGGYAIAKVLGLLLVTWASWLLSSLGIMPFGQWTIVAAWAAVAALSALLMRGRMATFLAEMGTRWRWIVAAETIFLAAYALMVWLRSHNAAFWTPGGADDTPWYLAMFNAAARSTSFPPFDAWLSGGQVHAPYWGMMPWVLMTRLTGVVPNTGYTLAFAGIFAVTMVSLWSVGSAMIRRIVDRPVAAGWLGLLAPLLVGIAGTLTVVARAGQGAWGFTPRPAGWPVGGLVGDVLYGIGNVLTQDPALPATFLDDVTGRDATFPFLTPFAALIVGDLSPVVTILPLFALALAVAVAIVRHEGTQPAVYGGLLMLGGGIAGAMSASATWGLLVTVAVIAASIVIRLLHTRTWSEPWPLARDIALHILAVLAVGMVAFFPFHREFHPTERNIVTGPGLSLQQLALIGGGFLLLAGVYLLIGTARVLSGSRDEGVPGRLAAGFTVLVAAGGAIAAAWLDSAALLLLIGLLLVTVALWHRQREPMHLMILAFIAVGMGILLYMPLAPLPATPFGETTAREMSTVAWMVLGMAATALVPWLAVVAGRLPERVGTVASTAAIGASTILLAGMLAAPVMTASVLTQAAPERSLDATAFLRTIQDPQASEADRAAAMWLMENVAGLPVILEAPGWDHQYGGRISAMTGLPAVLGWPTPERLTRPGWDGVVTQRQEAANRIYTSLDTFDSIEPLLEQYDVTLIYVGPLERATYNGMALRKFEVAAEDKALEVAYEGDGVVIYRYPGSP